MAKDTDWPEPPAEPPAAPTDVLPHRPPFLFLDRIVAHDDTRVIGERTFPADEPFFAGHFPGHPIVPGVVLIEGLAQTLAWLALTRTGGGTVLLTGVDGCRIRRPVSPGETVTYRIAVTRSRRNMVVAEGEVRVGDDRVLSATLKGFIQPPGSSG